MDAMRRYIMEDEDMKRADWQDQILDQSSEANGREIAIRAQMARRGYRLMHRRNGQYWVMFDEPMTLDEIETLATSRSLR
jgi:hypothetical protein